ncbi:MAG: hypothetical protein F9K29_19355 [Hyphomicrobiaceae bacterium]|nr:MAG: hypothetical protein F9K29_19355 [Hyphomicrobiaceae bacterium]
MFFLLKIAVPPVLVAIMSLAARRWGPTFGGLIMGLPWMTGPVLFFLALDKGEAFAVAACTGIEIGVVCISAFMLAYAVVTNVAGWPLCLAAAVAAFAATGWLTQGIAVPLWAATTAALASLAFCYALLPRPATSALPAALPAWDIPMRMLATLLLVAVIMLSADALGPRLSGVVSTYPVILTVIGAFTHHQWGRDAVRRVLRGLTLSLLGFVAFFLVLGSVLPALGLLASFLLATATGLSISAALIAVNRLRGA